MALFAPHKAAAVLRLDITQGNVQPVPIALPDFVGASATDLDTARNVTAIIASNHKRSGMFAPIDQAANQEKSINLDTVPQFTNRRAINAQALVTGRITRQQDGRVNAELRLWDVFAGQQLTGQLYSKTTDNWRRIAHIISDGIYERLTGEKGFFDSRIVFIVETGTKAQRIKRLAIMDQDGANVRYLTRGDELVLTPRFSRDFARVLRRRDDTVLFAGSCASSNSYYFDAHGDTPGLRPVTGLEHWVRSRFFPLSDYRFRRHPDPDAAGQGGPQPRR
jgi:TolB protein